MNPNNGGPCQGIRNSIPALEELGIYNEVVCLDAPDAAFLKKDFFKISAIGPGKGPWFYSADIVPWLINNLENFDIVIIHGLWLYHGYAVYKAVSQYRIKHPGTRLPKVYVMPHGMLDPYFQQAKGRKLKALRNWIYWKLIESKVINNSDGIFFTCEEELQLARKSFKPYNPPAELNIGYGITEPPACVNEMAEAFKERCSQLNGRSYFLFLSRIHEKKGVDLLIKAYLICKKTQPQMPALVIAGPGIDSSYGRYIKQLAASDDNIFFPGMLNGMAKWGAFYGCDAFVLPSHQENFGIAVVEALACKKPVLISNQVNIWREIDKGGGGIIAEDTVEGTSEMLLSWMRLSGDNKMKMSLQARLTFEEQFSIDKAAKKLLAVINK
jgi:glycosyltransferase involved in cell wall biosynthesis